MSHIAAVAGDPFNLEAMACAERYRAFLLGLVMARLDGGGEALDFGAGHGNFAQLLAGRGVAVTCVEPNLAFHDAIRRKGLGAAADLDAIAPESRGFVYSLNVLEHIDDDVAALREIKAVMRLGGRLFLYVPAFQCLYGPMDAHVGHVRRYSRRELEAKVRAAGFRVEDVRYADSLGFIASLFLKYRKGERGGQLSPGMVGFYDRFLFPVSRALDVVCGRWFGKNLMVTARKDGP